MPVQEFTLLDYLAAPILGVVYGIILFFICIIINYTLVTKRDDLTAFERVGLHYNLRLGPHKMSVIRRGGYVSTYMQEEEHGLKESAK